MNVSRSVSRLFLAAYFVSLAATAQQAPETKEPYEPIEGQAGKDVVWVPTPLVLVEKMLDMARVTPRDFVMDLGSGDGRNIIAAAKRGARALGVEYNPDMVELSRRNAAREGVADKAQFVQGDMYEADLSQATVLALFLLTENLNRLVPRFLEMKPGSRIVVNGFEIDDWKFDETGRSEGDCMSWCTAYLYMDRPSKLVLVRGMAQAAAVAAGADLDRDPEAYYGFVREAAAAYEALVVMLPKGTLPT